MTLLTDHQLEAAILHINPKDESRTDVARFFFQELMRRNEKRALDVLRRWQQGLPDKNS